LFLSGQKAISHNGMRLDDSMSEGAY